MVRQAWSWAVLVPVGSVALGFGLMAMVPGSLLVAVGVLAWKWADRLLAEPDDERWRSYMTHPSVVGPARRKVRGSR